MQGPLIDGKTDEQYQTNKVFNSWQELCFKNGVGWLDCGLLFNKIEFTLLTAQWSESIARRYSILIE
jgi:hypothetical protein